MSDNSSPNRANSKLLGAWFLGPEAENANLVEELLVHILRDYFHWRRNYFPADKIIITPKMRHDPELVDSMDMLLQRTYEVLSGLRRNFPFYNPRYIGHQLSDQTIPSIVGHFAGLLYNPNNVTPEAAPVTVEWELEVGADILEMLGYKRPPSMDDQREAKQEFGWAHITSGGTVANLEALWVARNVRYFPLAVRQVAHEYSLPVPVKLPNGQSGLLGELDDLQCLGLKPNEAIYLLAGFVKVIQHHFNIPLPAAARQAWDMLEQSGRSITHSGVLSCFQQWPPVVFVSGAAHYSVSKAADVLGIGKNNIELVDVDRHYRLDVRDLEQKLNRALKEGRYPLATIAIAGTTEEGAVDPVHQIADLRTRFEQATNQSFWLHVDAAWGGYIRSIFVPSANAKPDHQATLMERIDTVNQFISRRLQIEQGKYRREIQMNWGDKDVCSAFLAFPKAESITVDPHKMGYVPYPCGVVAFRNDRVRHFLTQEAPYITVTTQESVHMIHTPPQTVGPFILEGSKPGAAAVSTVLSHRIIPPNINGYGQIIRASLLAARELHERIVHWEKCCRANNQCLKYQIILAKAEVPDTNIVCFVVNEKGNKSLARMNRLTEMVYDKFTIKAELGDRAYSYSQPFFLSRTWFREPTCPKKAVTEFLRRVGIEPVGYSEQGIFVLRATVMSPYIVLAEENERRKSYLGEFMNHLGREIEQALVVLHQPDVEDFHAAQA
jgi:glutamate/tyrosine decarboxylase-like PLP-dependent enzyme